MLAQHVSGREASRGGRPEAQLQCCSERNLSAKALAHEVLTRHGLENSNRPGVEASELYRNSASIGPATDPPRGLGQDWGEHTCLRMQRSSADTKSPSLSIRRRCKPRKTRPLS